MNRIASVMVMHARDRVSWFLGPWAVLGFIFAIVWFIALCIDLLWGGTTPVYTGALASIYIMMLIEGISTVRGTFPFAVGFGTRRRDYLLGTLAWGGAICAAWAILLGLLLGSIYQRFGRTGEYIFFGVAFLFLSVFSLVSIYWNWWGAIFGWLAQPSAATLGVWLVPLMACFALASYALLRKATV